MELPTTPCTIPSIDKNAHNQINRESVTLIYFNPNADINQSVELINKLRSVVNFVHEFSDIDNCVALVKSIKKEKVVIIAFGLVNVRKFLSDLGQLRQLDSMLALKDISES